MRNRVQYTHLAKIIKDSHPFELLHLAMKAAQGHSWPQLLEGLIHELHLLACGQEDDDFGAQVRLDEGPQHIELLMQLTDHVSLQCTLASQLWHTVWSDTHDAKDCTHVIDDKYKSWRQNALSGYYAQAVSRKMGQTAAVW